MPTDMGNVQKILEKTLPEKIIGALADYDAFCVSPAPDDAKGFAVYQQACKAAVGHILLLFKLAAFGVQPIDGDLTEDAWLKQAKLALKEEDDDE